MLDIAFPLFFYGVSRSVDDLAYPGRMEFVRRHPYAGEVPTVSLATSRYSWRSMLWPVARYMFERYGLPNDGLVAQVDAEIPGSRLVRLDDMDHAEAALVGLPAAPTTTRRTSPRPWWRSRWSPERKWLGCARYAHSNA